jgi:hypothetical protein
MRTTLINALEYYIDVMHAAKHVSKNPPAEFHGALKFLDAAERADDALFEALCAAASPDRSSQSADGRTVREALVNNLVVGFEHGGMVYAPGFDHEGNRTVVMIQVRQASSVMEPLEVAVAPVQVPLNE